MAEPSPLLARPSPSPSLDRDPEKPATVSASADTAQQKYGHLSCAKRGYQLMDDPASVPDQFDNKQGDERGRQCCPS